MDEFVIYKSIYIYLFFIDHLNIILLIILYIF